MVTKKSAAKITTKIKATPAFDLSKLKPGGRVMYAQPIQDAIASGNAAQMRKLATSARSYVKELQTALARLEREIGD